MGAFFVKFTLQMYAMRLSKLVFLNLVMISLHFFASASRIEKGFIALNEFNYFEAKKDFIQSIKKDSSAASFGLATIYFRSDNPFHSLDSAYRYICISERTFNLVTEKEKVLLLKYGFEYLKIIELRAKISSEYYHIALKQNTIEGFDYFIKNNDWANERFHAIYKRDSLAFNLAKEINTSSEIISFMEKYPSSDFLLDAQKVLELCQYREATVDDKLESYILFCKENPRNRYVKDAEDRIYELSTSTKSLQEYANFVSNFPLNRNAEIAWRNIYQLFMIDYSDDRIQEFQSRYPLYPFVEELEQDIKYAKRQLIPFKRDSLFGFMDYDGIPIIEPMYDYLGFFNEGLAVAVKNGKYGYVDKGNTTIIDFIYDSGSDFEEGRAIVGIKEKVGVINRAGHIILPIDFKDIGSFSEGLIYAKKDSLYGYFDNTGFQRIEDNYSEAYSFSNGLAKVQLGNHQALIDIYGTTIVPPLFETIHFFNDSLLVFESNEKYGICRMNGSIIDSAKYDIIGLLSNNRALVKQKGKLGYMNGEGKIVLDFKYDEFPNFIEIGQFNGIYAIVRFKGKFGVIDHFGKFIVPATYPQFGKFSSLIAYSRGKGWGFIDLTNTSIIAPHYSFAESFNDGFAVVEKDTLIGLINPQGVVTVPIEFNNINRLDKDRVIVTLKNQQGVYNVNGEKIVPVEYQQIHVVNKDFLILTKSEEVHYLYLPQNKIIKPTTRNE